MVGLLWQRDRDDESLTTTLTHACRRYADRFGRWPTVAFVPEGNAADSVVLSVGGKSYTVELRPTRRVPANHVLVGIEGHDPSAPPTRRRAEERTVVEAASARTDAGVKPPAISDPDEESAAPAGEGEKPAAPSGAGRKRAAPARADRKRARKAEADSPPPDTAEKPVRRPVKRRSTMGWDPATSRDAATDEAGQLSFWQPPSRDKPTGDT